MLALIENREPIIIYKPIPYNFINSVFQYIKKDVNAKLEKYSLNNYCEVKWNTFGSEYVGYHEFIIIYMSKFSNINIDYIVSLIRKLIRVIVLDYSIKNKLCSPILNNNLFSKIFINAKKEPVKIKDVKDELFIFLKLDYSNEFVNKVPLSFENTYIYSPRVLIKDKAPVFLGYYTQVKKRLNLKEYICIKIFEKIIGTNESSSIYFPFRSNGDIYTAITQFFFDTQSLITGIFTTYSDEKKSIIQGINFMEILQNGNLDKGKLALVNELEFSEATSEYIFNSMPYNLIASNIMPKEFIINEIKKINFKDFDFIINSFQNIYFEVNL